MAELKWVPGPQEGVWRGQESLDMGFNIYCSPQGLDAVSYFLYISF